MFSKDAMSEVVVEIIESKKDEVAEKVLEQLESKKDEIESKVDDVMDKTEEKIESAVEDASKKIEDTVKDIIDKIDDNPQVAKVLDMVDDVIGDQLDGREISCSCFGFLWFLRISRKNKQSPPSKSEEKVNTSSHTPTPSTDTKEQLQSSSLPEYQSGSTSQ